LRHQGRVSLFRVSFLNQERGWDLGPGARRAACA
jgi:hypothetical protein